GEIQNLIGDLIVIPVGKDYQYPGAISQAVETTALQRKKMYQRPSHTASISIDTPTDIMDLILINCDIPTLGRAAFVSKLFATNFVNSKPLWKFIAERELPEQYKTLPLAIEFNFKNFVKENTNWYLSKEDLTCLE